MKLGIVGLPNVGKSTLFNAITNAGAQSANYAFCTIEPNIGVAAVPDKRLDVLSKMHRSEKITPAIIEFVDIAGLVRGASKGEGLGNKFLSHIHQVDAIVHTVRCFENDDIMHVDGHVDPLRDIETVNLELVFSDMELLERRIERTRKMMKSEKKLEKDLELFENILKTLERGDMVKSMSFTKEEEEILQDVSLLTNKPVIYAANLSEEDFKSGIDKNQYLNVVNEYAQKNGGEVLPVCARIEEEIYELSIEDKLMFLSELEISESGLDRLVKKCYSLLGLISYLTSGVQETRAWTITKGTKAPGAAGKIHSDFERGFIRAEIVAYKDLVDSGSMQSAKEKGLVRSEGKEYVMQDGDVVLFRFNV